VEDDPGLLDWIRLYWALVTLAVIIGVAGSALYVRAFPAKREAWSLVVEQRTAIPPRQLGPVASAVFHSAEVYRPVMEQLKVIESPQRFLDRSTDLRPVPDTNTLIVVGRSGSLTRAEEISNAMAASLVSAFKSRANYQNFTVFSEAEPAPIRQAVTPRQAVALGAGVGFWLGMGIAVLHYRLRRPLLTSATAARIMAGDRRLTFLERVGPSWLGILRSSPLWKETPRNRLALRGLVDGAGRPMAMAPGASSRVSRALNLRLDRATLGSAGTAPRATRRRGRQPPQRSDLSVLVCHPGTPTVDFTIAASELGDSKDRGRVEFVWVG